MKLDLKKSGFLVPHIIKIVKTNYINDSYVLWNGNTDVIK